MNKTSTGKALAQTMLLGSYGAMKYHQAKSRNMSKGKASTAALLSVLANNVTLGAVASKEKKWRINDAKKSKSIGRNCYMYNENVKNELRHFGVLGMKWGKRSAPSRLSPSGKVSSTTKKVMDNYNKMNDKEFMSKYKTTKNTYAKKS